MSFGDMIKESVLEGFQTDVSTTKICVTLGAALCMGLFVFVVYRIKTKSSFYSKDFNSTLAFMPLITAAIVLAMQSSLVISLGMVGALSIVRFRNAVKNALDLMFLFWSISLGIIVGAGLFEIAVILSCMITILMLVLDVVPVKRAPYLLVLHAEGCDVEKELEPVLKKYTNGCQMKSRSQRENKLDMIFEVRTKEGTQLVQSCMDIPSVKCAELLSHDGERRY